ncbi:MAG: MurR/RpiR family transcriptional regulator [Ruminococcaceae bacterium]|nr:MurR/RpiR family transcriptional regulator [Oscillospiraceae bacterium]
MKNDTLKPDLLKRIESNLPKMSKGHKLIANFILEHYDKAAYMTASKLGNEVGISESTVVRFADELGFDGYPDLQHSLREIVRNKLTTLQRIEITTDRIGNDDILDKVVNSDMDKIRRTLDKINHEHFNNAVDAILNAENIYILGMRSSSTIASFMSFYFNLIFNNVRHVSGSGGSEIFENIMRITNRDVMIGISFPRYSKRCINAVQFAKTQGAHIIALTDSSISPIASLADSLLLAESDMASFVDSLVAPLSIINAIIVAAAMKKKDDVAMTFKRLEEIWDEFEVYQKLPDVHF